MQKENCAAAAVVLDSMRTAISLPAIRAAQGWRTQCQGRIHPAQTWIDWLRQRN